MTTDRDYAAQLAQHDAAIDTLTKSQDELRRGVAALASEQRAGFERLGSALSTLQGAAGPSLRDTMTMIYQGGALFALVAAGIIWMASMIQVSAQQDMRDRLTRLETVLATVARLRPTPGAWDGASR
jgi:hypothetical protein